MDDFSTIDSADEPARTSTGAAGAPRFGDAYTIEFADVLLSLQLALSREQEAHAAAYGSSAELGPMASIQVVEPAPFDSLPQPPAPLPFSQAEPSGAPDVLIDRRSAAAPPRVWKSRTEPADPPLRDDSTGAGTIHALNRDLRLDRGRLYGPGGFSIAAIHVSPLADIRRGGGDQAAEAVLRALVEAGPFVLRAGDRMYRTNTDELVLLLPDADLTGAAAMCLRLQAAVKDVLERRALPPVILSARPFERAGAA